MEIPDAYKEHLEVVKALERIHEKLRKAVEENKEVTLDVEESVEVCEFLDNFLY